MNFPNEYKSRIFIRKFERDYAGRNLEYSFYDAYPLSINSMPVSYDESKVLQCTVNFCFSRYTINAPDGYTKPPSAPTSPPLPEEQKKSSKINDSFGGTAGPGTPFVERDTATGTDLTNGRGEPAEPLLLPDGSPVRDANGNFREMF